MILAAALLTASQALAQPPASSPGDDALARNFFESGRAYFAAARYDDAAAAFAEAYRLSGRAELLVNQARALESAGRSDEAIAALEQAQAELDESQTALRAQVEASIHRLRAERERELREARDEEAEIAPPVEQELPATPAPAPSSRRSGLFITGLSAAGLAGASLVVALGTGVRANALESELEGACPGDVCPASLADEGDRGRRLARTNTSFVFIGAGAAVAAVPLILLGVRDRRDGGDDDARVTLTGGPGDVGLGLEAQF